LEINNPLTELPVGGGKHKLGKKGGARTNARGNLRDISTTDSPITKEKKENSSAMGNGQGKIPKDLRKGSVKECP